MSRPTRLSRPTCDRTDGVGRRAGGYSTGMATSYEVDVQVRTSSSPLRAEEIRQRLARREPDRSLEVRSRTKPDGLDDRDGIIVALQVDAADASLAQRQATDVVLVAIHDRGIDADENDADAVVRAST